MRIFHLPDLGEGLVEAEIRAWHVRVGDTVAADQLLVSVETAKAVVDIPSPYAGRVEKLYGEVNDVIQTGAPLIAFQGAENLVGKLEESNEKWDESPVMVGSTLSSVKTIKAIPAVRELAKKLHVDLAHVTATGVAGQITLEDVKKMAAQQTTGAMEKLHGVRRTMALNMAQLHKQVVAVTVMEDADVTLLQQVDITACLLQAMVAGAKAEPALNAWFNGELLERKLFSEVNIGLAVDTKEGLFIPVIQQVEKLSQQDLRQSIDGFKKAAQSRTLSSHEMQGATITLSNFGTMTGRYANPVIVPPTVAILGCGRIREVVMPYHGVMSIRRVAPLSLSFDHRVVTGGEATRFLAAVIHYLEGQDK